MNPENRRGASIQLPNIDTIQEERPQQNNAVREDRFHYFDEIRRGSKKSGRLPKKNGIPWRGGSGLKDGVDNKKGGLVGGYYDSGINLKYNFPMSFALTLLSWSVLEYEHKYHSSRGEYDNVRDLIRRGTDYILLTFDSNSSSIDKVYSQVGSRDTGFGTPNDETCWERPEDMDYDERPVHTAPDLGGEMAAALAAASIVFVDDVAYSDILITMFSFARDTEKQEPYSWYSTGFWDEHVWGATWLYYATGDDSYLALATDPHLAQNANAASQIKYILGTNHLNLSYVVGYGAKFPRHVHHRGASIPNDGIKYSCTGGME